MIIGITLRNTINRKEVHMNFRNVNNEPYKSIAQNKGKYIATGMPSLDYALNDLAPALVTVISGRSNEGKTTFVRQVIANAINNDIKCCVINGEGHEELWINDLYRCVIGRMDGLFQRVKINKRYFKEPTDETLKELQQWHKDKLTVLHSKGMTDTTKLFEELSEELKKNRHELIVLDNLMSLLNASAVEKYTKQGEFVQNCHHLAVEHNIHIVLVVHPNKEYRTTEKPSFEMISGNSDIYNKADNIIWVSRNWEGEHGGKIKILKSRYFTEVPEVETKFDIETGLLCEVKDNAAITYKFNLNTGGHILMDMDVDPPFDL
jgi:predicted ATP-dependent serine protease